MQLKLARSEISGKPKSVSIDKIEQQVEENNQKIFYFDMENSNKDLVAFIEIFEKKGYSVYHRTIKYGLDENEYMYEVHIL